MATRADAGEVGALLHRFNTEFGDPSPGAKTLTRRVAELIQRGDPSIFLLAGPRDIGVAVVPFREALFGDGLTGYLEELYVVSDRRREGHGRELMETAMRLARERGATTMELGTAIEDTAARGLFERLGFSNLEKRGDPSSQMLFYERSL